MNKEEFQNFLNNHTRDELLEYQSKYGRDYIRIYFNLSYANFAQLIRIMDLRISKEEANKKRKETWSKKIHLEIMYLIIL